MRKPKALVIQYRFHEGYPEQTVVEQVDLGRKLLDQIDIDYVMTDAVTVNAEADIVARKYNPTDLDFVILLIPTWIEPTLVIAAAKPYLDRPVIVWGYGTYEHKGWRVDLGSMPGSGVVKGTLRELGISHEYLYYMPGNPETDEVLKRKIVKVANVARGIRLLEASRVGTIGVLFCGMSIGDVDVTDIRRVLGPEITYTDTYTFVNQMEKIQTDSDLYRTAEKHVSEHLAASLGNRLEPVTRMYIALRDLAAENDLDALTVKCNFELSQEYGQTACVPLSVLGNELVASCEADIPILLTQMMFHYLSDGGTTTYADVHELLLSNRALIGACGFAPSGMCLKGKIVPDFQDESATGLGATFSGYVTNKSYLKEGKVTFGRLLKDPDRGYTLHVTTGTAVGDVGKVAELDTPQYPFTEIELDADVDRFAQNMGSHHYALVYGDITEQLELFCRTKGIRYHRD